MNRFPSHVLILKGTGVLEEVCGRQGDVGEPWALPSCPATGTVRWPKTSDRAAAPGNPEHSTCHYTPSPLEEAHSPGACPAPQERAAPPPQPRFLCTCFWDHVFLQRQATCSAVRRMQTGCQDSGPPSDLCCHLTHWSPHSLFCKVKTPKLSCKVPSSYHVCGSAACCKEACSYLPHQSVSPDWTGPHTLSLCTVIYIPSDHQPALPP